jgi:hypothetical protein
MSIKININNTTWEIPERLTLDQYSKAIQFDWDDPNYHPMVVSQLTGAPLHLLIKGKKKAMYLGMALLVKSMNQRTECKMIDLDKITFGQFVDLDVWITEGIVNNFKSIAALLAPEAKWADEAMWAVDQYVQFRQHTLRQYSVLFGINERATSEELEEEGQKDRQHNARSWYKIIVGLANGDLLKIDAVTEQPLKKTLNFMSLQKAEQLEENQRKLKERRQYDLSRNRR